MTAVSRQTANIPYMPTMRDRIEKAIRDSGKKPSEIAEAVGVSTAAVAQWVSRDTKSLKAANLLALAKATGKSTEWLATGKGPEQAITNASDLHHIGADVPVIPFATLADVRLSQDSSPATMAISWTICPVKHGPRTFCIQMPDDSMTALDPLAIYRGSWLHIDPDQSPAHNQAVLAMLDGGGVVVANYMAQAGRQWLHLLNPAYPPLPTSFELLGRVIYVAVER